MLSKSVLIKLMFHCEIICVCVYVCVYVCVCVCVSVFLTVLIDARHCLCQHEVSFSARYNNDAVIGQ